MDRLLATPAHRAAVLNANLAFAAVTTIIQTAIVLVLGAAVGARFHGGAIGVITLVVCAVLIAMLMGSFSNSTALSVRKEESVIGLVQFLALPLVFLSAGLSRLDQAPAWLRHAAKFNPLNWAVEAGRDALTHGLDWGYVGQRLGPLTALMLAAAWLATGSFRAYQKSI